MQQLLGIVALSHKAAAAVMSDSDAPRTLLRHDWQDDGAAVAGLTDWAAQAALNPSSPEFVLAKQATADLIRAVTVHDSDEGSLDHQTFKRSLDGVKANPLIAQALSKLIAANLSDFGADEPSQVTGPGDENHLRISTDQRHRFAMLASTDQDARILLRLAADAYKTSVLSDPTSTEAKSAGFVDAMVTAAGHNAVYYDHINDADAVNKARAAAQADEQMVKSVATYLFGEIADGIKVPGKVTGMSADVGRWVLGRVIDEGLMQIPEPATVLPTTVDTDADATGVGVAENHAAHDLANARVRTGDTTGLNPQLLERGSDGRPHLKGLSAMTTDERRLLQTWARTKTGGGDYIETYANAFRGYYGLGEKIEDGPDGLRNFVEAPTRRPATDDDTAGSQQSWRWWSWRPADVTGSKTCHLRHRPHRPRHLPPYQRPSSHQTSA
ncbi:hypothetical protein ACIBL3_46655 [Kribbella sp. NPDC050124]|uniref:hypothetical protein n=1 Tax=Kribbella sp. NPDC050124 TaxID=3364114 RepID=UPI00379F410B